MSRSLQQQVIDTALSDIRRAYNYFSSELNEFVDLSLTNDQHNMAKVREVAHARLDAYLDALSSAHVSIRAQGVTIIKEG